MDRVCRDCGRPFWSDDVDEFDTSGLCPKCKNKELEHKGIWHNRTEPNWGYTEKVFADKWAEMNELDCCTNPTLNTLLNKKVSDFHHVTQRDATIAATVIQWLGSNVGNCFVQECLKEIKKQRKECEKRKWAGAMEVIETEVTHTKSNSDALSAERQ